MFFASAQMHPASPNAEEVKTNAAQPAEVSAPVFSPFLAKLLACVGLDEYMYVSAFEQRDILGIEVPLLSSDQLKTIITNDEHRLRLEQYLTEKWGASFA